MTRAEEKIQRESNKKSAADLWSSSDITRNELAKMLNVDPTTIKNWLKSLNAPTRVCRCGCGDMVTTYGEFINGHNSRLRDTNEWRNDPNKLAVSNLKISKTNKGRVARNKIEIPPKEDMEFLYLEKCFSANKIKNLFSTSGPTIKKWLAHYDIPVRSMSQSVQNAVDQGLITNTNAWRKDPEKARLANSKISESNKGKVKWHKTLPDQNEFNLKCEIMTSSDLGQYYNVSPPTISKWKSIFDIKSSFKKKIKPFSSPRSLIASKEDLEFLYHEKKYTENHISRIMGVSQSVLSQWMRHYGFTPRQNSATSYPQYQIKEFVSGLGLDTLINVRSLIPPLELDVVVPSKKIAIEMDGVYWHSELSGKTKSYHLNKTKQCEAKGYQLFHVFDNEWQDKKEIWKSVIKNALGFCDRKIGARQCKIVPVLPAKSSDFLNHNHLQGPCQSSVRYGLEFNGELVSLMTFGKSRFSKKYDWELIRFCSSLDTVVIGGAGRLLSHFRKHHLGRIVSYANRRWSTGHLYETLGFLRSHTSSPNYFYWATPAILESRVKYQKHKLKDILSTFNPKLTEWQNMMANGYNRIWDCGNIVYEL